ncbi:GTP-binding protein [Humibacter antri]
MSTTPRIPVTVLTGFLGSGKTTMVNHILTAEHGMRIAIIENEFGDINVDSALVVGGDEKLIEMSNGCCLCCTARTDLIEILNSLYERKERFDRIIIETSGMADPNPIAQTFYVDEEIADRYHVDNHVGERFRLDAIVTLVDAKHVEQHLDDTRVDGVGNHTSNQIAFGDRIVINKIDLIDEAQLERVKARIRSINQSAEILTSSYGAVDLCEILGINAFARHETSSGSAQWLEENSHVHSDGLEAVAFEIDGRFRRVALEQCIAELAARQGDDLYRYKGVIHVEGDSVPHLLQGVHQLYNLTAHEAVDLKLESSVFVFIGRNLDRDELEASLRECVAEPALIG